MTTVVSVKETVPPVVRPASLTLRLALSVGAGRDTVPSVAHVVPLSAELWTVKPLSLTGTVSRRHLEPHDGPRVGP